MIISILEKSEGALDAYRDPTITWIEHEIDATTVHPLRGDELSIYQKYGAFRGAMYKLTFDSRTRNIGYIDVMNRLIFFGAQYDIAAMENWTDFNGAIIRVCAIVGKCTNTVSYTGI